MELKTKTARELQELKKYLDTHLPTSRFYLVAKQEFNRGISMKNELKELFLFSEYPSSCCTKCDEMHRFIQEIESVENDKSKRNK